MNYDPNGNLAQIVIGAVVGALINTMSYYLELVVGDGVNNASSHIDKGALALTAIRGAATGAIGFGLVNKIKTAATLESLETAILSFNIGPLAYAIGQAGNYSTSNLAENQFLSLFGKQNNALYQAIEPVLNSLIDKYR